MFSRHVGLVVYTLAIACAAVHSAFCQDTPDVVTIAVDKSVTYQTIDGFGAHGAMNVWWGNGPFFNQEFLDSLIDDMGLTTIRNEYYPTVEEPNQWAKQVPYL
jgi:hypothetical protein